jgi:hypothetical protein
MDFRHSVDGTPSGNDLAPDGRVPAAGMLHGSPFAEDDSQDQLLSGQSYNRVTAGGNSRLHAGNVYNNYYQAEPSKPRFASTHPKGTHNLETFRRCLSFEQMETRLASIATAHPDTCEWIIDCPQFKRWRDPNFQAEHHGCLWIKGKPGAGKSTIMKNLLRHIEAAEAGDKVVSFFFNARGATLERTTEGLYRSLLYQMAGDVPSPLIDLRAETIELYSIQGWSLELLKDLCRKALRQLASETKLTVFIDALDEGNVEDDIRDMVIFSDELATEASSSGQTLNICLASRHYPTISIVHSELLILDALEDHNNDIIAYARAQLRVKSPALRAQLVSAITVRASGIFLWVTLVVKILNKEADRGNQHRLKAKLQELPTGLHALFEAIVEKDSDHDHHLLPTLIWVLFALGSLTLVEMYFAIMISTDQLDLNNIVWDPDVVDQTVLANFLLASSRGLLEYVEPPVLWKAQTGTGRVQIIHESVREYLLTRGLQKLDEDLGQNTEAKCYGRLAKWCTKYIQSTVQFGLFGKDEQARSMRQCPLLEYATENCLTYAEQAAQQGYRQSVCTEAPIETWRLIADIRNPHPDIELPTSTVYPFDPTDIPTGCIPVCTTMLHLFIQQCLPCLADIELEQNVKRDSEERQMYLDAVYLCADGYGNKTYRSGCSALGMAVFMDNVRVTRALLRGGTNVNVSCKIHGPPLEIALRRVWGADGEDIEHDEYDEYASLPGFVRDNLEIAYLLLQDSAASRTDKPYEIAFPLLRAIETKDWAMVKFHVRDTSIEDMLAHGLWDDSCITPDDLDDSDQASNHGKKAQSDGSADTTVAWPSLDEANIDPSRMKPEITEYPRDQIADSNVLSRIHQILWGHSIRQNPPC